MQVTFDSSAVRSRHTFPSAKLVRFIIGRAAFGSLPNACGFGIVCAMLSVPIVTWIAITLISNKLNLTYRSSFSPFFNRLPIWLRASSTGSLNLLSPYVPHVGGNPKQCRAL
jgi:hypothetical protein